MEGWQWSIRAEDDSNAIVEALQDGWEPFSAQRIERSDMPGVPTTKVDVVYFRKQAYVVPPEGDLRVFKGKVEQGWPGDSA